MPSNYQTFFNADCFAVIGRSSAQPFPILTYRGLKRAGKPVFAIDPSVDPSVDSIDGDPYHLDLASLPQPPQAVIIETPKQETAQWVQRAADAKVKDVWIHRTLDSPEARAIAQAQGINRRTGTWAVMYLTPGFSYHSIHRLVAKWSGRY